MAWVEHDYKDRETMQAALAELLRERIQSAIDARGKAWLALAGGSTPLPMYRQLAQAMLPWQHVVIVPTDERCVPHAHPACNARALVDAFSAMRGGAVIPLTREDGEPHASVQRANDLLSAHPDAFDLVMLGMGEDAHTASLFPGAAELPAALADDAPDAVLLHPDPLPPEAPFARITLSAQRLRNTRELHLLITGDAKRAALRRAQASQDPLRTPVSAFMHDEDGIVHIHWSP